VVRQDLKKVSKGRERKKECEKKTKTLCGKKREKKEQDRPKGARK
jgi:hypothetical protein